MIYKAIIFDLDGTLLNTLNDIGNAMNRVLTKEGFPMHPLDAYRYFVGDGATMLVTRTLPEKHRDDETTQHCLNAFRKDYSQNWAIETKPYEGIPEMLDVLATHGLKMAILSNKPDEVAKHSVAAFFPDHDFAMVLGQRDGIPRKPDPTGALEIADHLHLPPLEFLYLGDTSIDMQTAIAAQMYPVGVLWGFRSKRELQQSGAQRLLDQPSELLSFIASRKTM